MIFINYYRGYFLSVWIMMTKAKRQQKNRIPTRITGPRHSENTSAIQNEHGHIFGHAFFLELSVM
jgi:hypothetical protein